MRVIRDMAGLVEAAAARSRLSGLGGAFVPTMGALHDGHAALIRRAAEIDSDCAVASIFVNPTQFNDPEDFQRYPKTLEADLELCRAAGATAVFVPGVETMYPDQSAAPVPNLPRVATEPGLEDRFRPGHFAGVCQVVMRLFRLIGPEVAIFGEKDWQQLQVVSAMTNEAGLPIRIEPHPTLRDPDGLAMSSRNRFLTNADRAMARGIPEALRRAGEETRDWKRAEKLMWAELQGSSLEVEYAAIRNAKTLSPIESEPDEARALIAARVGAIRLIDNAPWPPRSSICK